MITSCRATNSQATLSNWRSTLHFCIVLSNFFTLFVFLHFMITSGLATSSQATLELERHFACFFSFSSFLLFLYFYIFLTFHDYTGSSSQQPGHILIGEALCIFVLFYPIFLLCLYFIFFSHFVITLGRATSSQATLLHFCIFLSYFVLLFCIFAIFLHFII